jgi:uncharacterized membrane protein
MIPMLYAVAAIAAGIIVPRVESRFLSNLAAPVSVDSAIAIYSSIASGMMALTGIVFSLTFVMVQFSASAYSPRLVLWIALDPALSHALGTFSATFLYAVAALAWLDRSGSPKVPFVSAWLVVGLLLASVAMLVVLIHRVGLLHVNRMLVFTCDRGRRVVKTLYKPFSSSFEQPSATECAGELPIQTLLHHGRPRSLQAIQISTLLELAKASGGCIDISVAVGDTVLDSMPLLRVFGTRNPLPEAELRRALEFGEERTFEQDPKYAIRLLVDIAIKALSPAINDPTTAVQALDHIGDLLLLLGGRQLEIGTFRDDTGQLRLAIPFPSWDDFLHLAFEEILSCGAKSVQVMRRMRALVADLLSVLPAQRHASLHYWQRRLRASIARSFEDAEEKLSASMEDRQGLGVARGSVVAEESLHIVANKAADQ